jgi:hypothetical protein
MIVTKGIFLFRWLSRETRLWVSLESQRNQIIPLVRAISSENKWHCIIWFPLWRLVRGAFRRKVAVGKIRKTIFYPTIQKWIWCNSVISPRFSFYTPSIWKTNDPISFDLTGMGALKRNWFISLCGAKSWEWAMHSWLTNMLRLSLQIIISKSFVYL